MTHPNEPDPQDAAQPGPPPPPYGQAPPPPYGQPQYGQPPYGQPPYGQPQQPYLAPRSTNGFAIASIICAFLCSPLGVIFGMIAKSQISKNGQPGDSLATAGIILSIVLFVLGIVLAATGHASFHVGNNNGQ